MKPVFIFYLFFIYVFLVAPCFGQSITRESISFRVFAGTIVLPCVKVINHEGSGCYKMLLRYTGLNGGRPEYEIVSKVLTNCRIEPAFVIPQFDIGGHLNIPTVYVPGFGFFWAGIYRFFLSAYGLIKGEG